MVSVGSLPSTGMDTGSDTQSDTGPYTGPDPATEAVVGRGAAAYDWIKQELLSGAFALGTRLAEERLARALDVSRTPVREALGRLHAEGLVERHPDGGYTPSVPDLGEIVELYEVRSSLEHAALDRGCDDAGRAALGVLRDEWVALADEDVVRRPDPAFVLLDEDFHVRLAAAAGNHALVGVLSGVNERIRVVRMHDFLSVERIEATIAQHLGILDAVLDGAPPAAAVALRAHLEESAAVVQDRAAQAIARMVRGTRELR